MLVQASSHVLGSNSFAFLLYPLGNPLQRVQSVSQTSYRTGVAAKRKSAKSSVTKLSYAVVKFVVASASVIGICWGV